MKHLASRTIETPRLILRRLSLNDASDMYKNWAFDPQVCKFLTWPAHKTIKDTEDILRLWELYYKKEYFYQWGMEFKEIGQVIGTISGMDYNEPANKIDIGYCIGRKWWNKGLTTEAFQALLAFFFEKVGINRIQARHDVNNPASGEVMKKCGLIYEGKSRQSSKNNMGLCDCYHYAILKSDYDKMYR